MAAQLLADSAGDMARANLMSAVWWYATMYYRMNDVDMLEQYVAAGLPAALSKVILARCSVTADAAFNELFDKEFRALMPPQLRGEVVDVWRHVCSFLIESNRSSQMSVSLCSDILGEILYDVTTRRQPVLDVVPSFPAVVDKIMPFLRMPRRAADATANVCKLMRLAATGSDNDGFPLVWALIDGGACAWCVAQLAAFHRENAEGKRIDVAITAISVIKLICDAVDHRFPPPPGPDAAAAAAAAAAAVDVDDGLSRPTSAAADAFVQSHLVDIGAGAAVAHAFDEMAKVWMTECAHGHSHLHPCVFRIFCGAFAQLGRHSPAFLRHFGAAQVTFRATAYEVVAALVVEVATRVGIQLALLRAMNALLGAMRKEPPIFTAFTDLLELLAQGIVTQNGTFGAPEEFFLAADGGEGDDGGGPALLLAQPDDGDLDDVDGDGDGGGDGEDDGDGDGDGNLEEPV
jgi:hypothetical protein